MAIAALTFFSQISDPRFGGTYMTILTTIYYVGGTWTYSVAMGMIDILTFKQCSSHHNNNCSTADLMNVRNSNIIS